MRAPSAAGLALAAAALLVLATAAFALAPLEPGALWNRAVAYVFAVQRDLHRELAAAMRNVQANEAAAAWSLAGLGFLYGVFHAAGPGHGKIVISTYLATHESRIRRGVALSVLSSLLQGATALGAVGVTVAVLDRSFREAQGTVFALESVSYALVGLLGLFLVFRSGRRLLARHRWPSGNRAAASAHRRDTCGHGHGPGAADLAAPPSLHHFVATVLSVGLRPCSGAILVLVLAHAMKLVWAGVAAVVAMSAGTALTVSALAALSVYARKSAITLGGYLSADGPRFAQILDGIGMLGGILIVLFGMALLQASLITAQHPLL
jgi:ABC-type nickel/cobalt efflux system permease component RcnA